MRPLLQLVGNWSVRWTNRVAAGGYETVDGTAEIVRDPIGCILTERFFAKSQDKPYQVLRLTNLSSPDGVESLALDSEHGRFLRFVGAANERNLSLTWASDDGGRMRVRYELRLGDRTVQTGEYRRASLPLESK